MYKEDNYLWEESFGDEKGRPQQQVPATTGPSGSFSSSAILQDMLKEVNGTPTAPFEPQTTEEEPLYIRAPLMSALPEDDQRREHAGAASSAVQNLLQLAEEAERQAHLTSEAADTANKLTVELIAEMQNGGEGLQQLCVTAGKNAYLAAEAAVRAQLSAMETHAAAVNQSLAELENAKDALHHHSQGFIHLSKQAAQAQEDAELAREKAERTRLEYAAKQNASLSNRDTLAQSKREYETKLNQTRFAQENLDLAQKKARAAQNEYLRLKEALASRRQQWQSIQHIYPEPQQPQPAPTQLIAEEAPETDAPGAVAAERRQIAALVLPAPEHMPVEPLAAPEPLLSGPSSMELDDIAAQAAIFTEDEKEETTKGGFWRIYGKIIVLALAVAICLRLFVLDVVMVDGSSMQPNLQNSDSLISSKLAYVFQEPQRFDIILLDAPDGNGYYIKRVIGLPNDQLRIEDGQIYINDELLAEPFITGIYTEGDINTVIPDGYYFVMGDNRAASRDSRESEIGPIAKEHITGKAILRIWPLGTMKIL